MGDAIIISSVVISILGAIAALCGKLHFKRCKSMCCESDCVPSRNVSRNNSTANVEVDIKHSRVSADL